MISSSLTTGSATAWNSTGSLFLGSKGSTTIAGKTYTQFSGSFQELRFYDINLSENRFDEDLTCRLRKLTMTDGKCFGEPIKIFDLEGGIFYGFIPLESFEFGYTEFIPS